jgi:hypothetical protein
MDTERVQAARFIVSSFLTALVGIAFGASCFSEPSPNCAFSCGAASECPSGYFCASDSYCKQDGLGDDFSCGPSLVDATSVDASSPDAALPVAPTISTIDDQTTAEDTPLLNVAFTIGDDETAPADLVVSAASSQQLVVASSGLVLGGTDSARTISLTPVANAAGTSEITITVSDGTNQSTESFMLTVTPDDDTPTITTIDDQTTSENTALGPIAFTIGDLETAPSALVVTAVSSNLTVLPQSGIVLGGSDANQTITITPATDETGASTVSITVSDGVNMIVETFVVTVNAAPTISTVADQVINVDTSTAALAFTIGDAETAPAALIVTATSDNATLVPNNAANLILAGADGNRTLVVSPATGEIGIANITITVDDGVDTAQTTFELTVNSLPTITAIGDETIVEDADTGALAFTIGDVETAVTALVVTALSSNTALVDTAEIALVGTDANRTITVSPKANQFGTTTITVTVDDGTGGTAQEAFLLTVTSDNDPPAVTAPADLTIGVSSTTGALAVTVSDVETAAGDLGLTAASSNLTLVDAGDIVLGGADGARTITITPNLGQTGTTTITLTIEDGTTTTEATFVLTVS